ncbi:MAG: hypothetical protein HUU44_15995 [Ignavibacteriaceae bacterium]|nr:hypothetical protein [Ignavibacteriaceae bacterium]
MSRIQNKNNLRIIIARIDRIGDVVLSTPISREIKRVYPDSFVSVLVKKYTKDIYLNNPNVDDIILYDGDDEKNPKSFWQLVQNTLTGKNIFHCDTRLITVLI